MTGLPSGTVVFLFTDIEGSSRLWERDEPSMRAAVDRHLALIDTVVAAHRGVRFKVVGDAVQAAFPAAADALAAALDAQHALLGEHWPTADPIRVRMALHAGEAVPDEHGDYLAAPLNRLARLLAIGHGGQVLLSQAVQQLVRGDVPAGAALEDLGEHRLRDLLEPERVFQLVHPELPAAFPPLKSLAARPNNLPLQPTPFLGREEAVREVGALLRRPDVRLLTMTGPGGSGKTRLALQVAAEAVDDFQDGVFFVALAPLADPAAVPGAVAAALGVREEGGRSLADRLLAYLAGKHVLLVLDNFEHLAAGAPFVAEMLAAAPSLEVLATSRLPLHLRAEHEYPVPTLALPPRRPPPTAEQLTQYDAVRLFIDRARAVKPDFVVGNDTAPAIAEICWRLDGLPLAIELAAARIRLLPPQAMLDRLEKRLNFLTGGARDAPQRQRTLRDAIGWSHDLLDPNEQTLFRRLAVFAGGWTVEAADAVANADGALDVFGTLERLVEHSLVRLDEGAASGQRFGMLETVREFGLERLIADAESDWVADRHAEYFAAWVETVEPGLRAPGQIERLAQVDAEQDNLRNAMAWTLARQPATALRLAAAQHWYWFLRGRIGEGRGWLERALASAPEASGVRSAALNWASFLAWNQGDGGVGLARAEEAREATDASGDARGLGWALLNLGAATRLSGDHARASGLTARAREAFLAAGERWGGALAAYGLGMAEQARGRVGAARSLFEQALAEVGVTGDRAFGGWVRAALGGAAFAQGDLDDANALLTKALADARALGFGLIEAQALQQLAGIAVAGGNADRAEELLAAAEALYRDNGLRSALASCRHDLGLVALGRGDNDGAEHLFAEALAIACERNDAATAALVRVALGDARLAHGDAVAALARYREALTAPRSPADLRATAGALRGFAAAALAERRPEAAVRLLAAEEAARGPERLQVIGFAAERRDRDVLAARAELGAGAFAAAWAEGAALTVGAAVAEALIGSGGTSDDATR